MICITAAKRRENKFSKQPESIMKKKQTARIQWFMAAKGLTAADSCNGTMIVIKIRFC